jgi:bifunctional enzyme CysN/CysC
MSSSINCAKSLFPQCFDTTRQDREVLKEQKGLAIWLTGLSGSGKSTLANALERSLYQAGKHTYVLDGDNIRHGLNKDLGFTDEDRVENIRRIAEVGKLMVDAGLIVITAFISPFLNDRKMARELIGENNFLEIYVSTPLSVCEQRDPKGLYKKARSGSVTHMTGISSPYEAPDQPDFVAQAGDQSIASILENLLPLVMSKTQI